MRLYYVQEVQEEEIQIELRTEKQERTTTDQENIAFHCRRQSRTIVGIVNEEYAE
jgi:hypothetical protein